MSDVILTKVAKRQNLTTDAAELQSELGRSVKVLRNQLGITQEELAWRANLHRTYIADIERGGRNITLRNIANLAKALEVTVANLLSLPGEAGQSGSDAELGEVLLVEDEPADVELTLRAFARARLRNPIRVARDGAEALELLLGLGAPPVDPAATTGARREPALVLLDLKLPKVSGLEVLQRLKADEHARAIPVVVLTSSHQDRTIQECARLGAVNYILKPLDFEGLSRVTPSLSLAWALLKSPSL